MEQMQSTLSAADVEVYDIRRSRPRMEEAFISLVRREMEGQGRGPSDRPAEPVSAE